MSSIRETFLPDDGCVFVRCDLSQIEDRMCKMYCGTERMIELANLRPEVYDAHTENASLIFKKPKAQISKDERYLGKRTTHASQRGMRGNKLSENISKDTEGKVFIHPAQCDKLIDAYLNAMWEIRDLYFPWVEHTVRNVGMLVTSWGRRLDLRNRRVEADLYREAYSFYMQAECCDEATEVLTMQGFIPFERLKANEKIAVYYDNEIFFEVPKRVIKKQYNGEMISFEGTRLSQVVTPNHRMLYVTNGNAKVIEARELSNYKRFGCVACGEYLSGEIELNNYEVVLLVAIQADGSIARNALTWHFSKERKIIRLRETLIALNIQYTETKQKDGTTCFYVHTKNVGKYLSLLDEKKYCDKILDLSLKTRKMLVNELYLWDGSKPKSNPNSFWYDSTIKQNTDWMQIAAILSGQRAMQTISLERKGNHVAVNRVYINNNTISYPSKIEKRNYNGMVYCVTVSTGAFVIRRDGKVSITGNCADWTNQYGFIPAHYWMMGKYGRPLNAQVHDELIASVPLLESYEYARFIVSSFEQYREIPRESGHYLCVPADVTVGRAWEDKKAVEFKRLPSKDDYYQALWKGGFFDGQ